MKKLHLAIALSMVAVLAIGSIAVARKQIGADAIFSNISITKTYDIYGVLCTSGPCQEEGKCLGTMDACTCLTLCGLQFDVANTEYWVYNWPEGIDDPADVRADSANLLGWSVNGERVVSCICQATDYGRVKYHLLVYAKNNGRTPSQLINATLCLAAETTTNDRYYVGADYEQVADVYGGEALLEVILPEPTNEDVGENVILCPMCPDL
jgi:hypothetical protein